jgi:drug/metabolite transporter (DMT)-like permease
VAAEQVHLDAKAARLAGIGFMVAGVTLFSWHDGLNKWLVGSYFAYQLFFLRSVFTGIPIAMLIWRAGGPGVLRMRHPAVLAWRCVLLFLAFSCWIGALSLVPLADIVAISMAMPIVTTAFGALLLGERVDRARWCAILAGFAGVLLVVGPSDRFPLPATMLAASGVTFYALAFVVTRRLGTSEQAETMVALQAVVNAAASGVILLLLPGRWIDPLWHDWLLFAASGLCAGFAQFLMTSAFRVAPLSVVAPFEYMGILWAILLGIVVWNQPPGPWTLVGAAVIVVSGLYLVRRDALQARA